MTRSVFRPATRLAVAAGMVACSFAFGQSARVHTEDELCLPPLEHGCGKAEALKRLFLAGRAPSDMGPGYNPFEDREAMSATDVLSNDLDIAITPTSSNITGSNTITLTSLVNNLTQFTFMLRNNYTVSSVTVNGNAVAIPATPANGNYSRTLTLDRAYNAGETLVIKISYSGTAVNVGLGSINFTTQSGTPVVASLSEPYYAGTWFPCKDGNVLQPGDNIDKMSTWKLALTTPSNLVGVSNGSFQGVDTLGDGRKRWRWQSNYPMATYLACFGATNYNSYSINYTWNPPGGPSVSFPFRYYLYPSSDTASNRAAWERVTQMFDALFPVYGVYPFPNEGYGMYMFPFGGGMEHQTMTGQNSFSDTITVHELGHQWWGDNVTCRYWNDIWFNEGMATYTEAIWAERKTGSTGSAALQSAMIARKPASTAVGGTVYVYDTSNVNAVFDSDLVYNKAAWVWHMMRGQMGDATFWNFLGAIRSNFTGSAISTAQIESTAEAVSGQDLTSFFNEWVYTGGAPTYVSGSQSFVVNGKNYCRFHIRQSSNPTYQVFTTPIDMLMNTSAGAVTSRVRPLAATSWFTRAVPAAVTSISLDPSNWVLNYGKTSETFITAGAPPVVLETSPLPGAAPDFRTAPSSATVTFSSTMNVSAGNFQVFRSGGGSPVPFTFGWNPTTLTATLQFASKLSPADYTIQVSGATSTASVALDGELANPNLSSSLPSGNGVAGGTATYNFSVVAGPCPADLNNDGIVDDVDFVLFAEAYNTFLTMAGDISGDALTDDTDFVLFADAYNNYFCP
ncbi:MAG: M1 family aminopeptidase [Phycisphaerales bacterium]|nr:hypothetical protein [Planctomycetota bacterium]